MLADNRVVGVRDVGRHPGASVACGERKRIDDLDLTSGPIEGYGVQPDGVHRGLGSVRNAQPVERTACHVAHRWSGEHEERLVGASLIEHGLLVGRGDQALRYEEMHIGRAVREEAAGGLPWSVGDGTPEGSPRSRSDKVHPEHSRSLGDDEWSHAREGRAMSLIVVSTGPSVAPVMLSMFVLWIVVFIGIFRGWRWTPFLVLATLAWTLVLLKLHMTSDLPLSF